jgi:hypothetical protein
MKAIFGVRINDQRLGSDRFHEPACGKNSQHEQEMWVREAWEWHSHDLTDRTPNRFNGGAYTVCYAT